MAREATTRILDMVEDGVLDAATALRDALNYMSEDEVKDFAARNYYFEHDEDEDTDEDEDPEDEARGSRCGPDCGWCGACS